MPLFDNNTISISIITENNMYQREICGQIVKANGEIYHDINKIVEVHTIDISKEIATMGNLVGENVFTGMMLSTLNGTIHTPINEEEMKRAVEVPYETTMGQVIIAYLYKSLTEDIFIHPKTDIPEITRFIPRPEDDLPFLNVVRSLSRKVGDFIYENYQNHVSEFHCLGNLLYINIGQDFRILDWTSQFAKETMEYEYKKENGTSEENI